MNQPTDLANLYAEHFAQILDRTHTAMAACGVDRLAIFAGAEQVSFRDDWHYPFKANPHLLAWLPLTEHPYCWLIVELGQEPKLLYYQPDDYWHKPPADPAGDWVEHVAIEILRTPGEAIEALGNIKATALVGEIDHSEFDNLDFASRNEQRLINQLEYPRAAKTRYELHCMRQAQTTAVRAHRAAETAFRDGASEYDIHQAYLRAGQLQDRDLPYSNIVALNRNGAVLHYQHLNREAPANSRSFLIDAGATYNGYAADITRTYARGDNQFAEMIQALDKEQRMICDMVQSGTDYRQLHLNTHHAIASLLQRFGLVKMEPDSIVDTGISATFFPHGVGHLIGLQTHDCGGFQAGPDGGAIDKPDGHPYLRLTRTLEPGFVVTIEPGIYFIEPLLAKLRESQFARAVNWSLLEQFMPFGGIRIEDDVATTIEQPENMTRLAFAAME